MFYNSPEKIRDPFEKNLMKIKNKIKIKIGER